MAIQIMHLLSVMLFLKQPSNCKRCKKPILTAGAPGPDTACPEPKPTIYSMTYLIQHQKAK